MNDIEFTCGIDSKFTVDHYPPVSYRTYKHSILSENKDMKTCPGMNEMYNFGYVIPAWFDMTIEYTIDENEEQNVFVNTPSHAMTEWLSWHDPEGSMRGVTSYALNDNYYYRLLKVTTPWLVKFDPKYLFLQKNLDFQFDEFMIPASGVQHSADSNITVPFYFRNITKQVPYKYKKKIRAGDPLCHLLFLESNQNFNMKVTLQNQEMVDQHRNYKMAMEQHFSPLQVYKMERKMLESNDE